MVYVYRYINNQSIWSPYCNVEVLRIWSCARMRTKNKLWNNIVLSVTFWPTNKTTAAVCCYSHCPCSSSKDAMHNNIIVINHRNNISNIFCMFLQMFGSQIRIKCNDIINRTMDVNNVLIFFQFTWLYTFYSNNVSSQVNIYFIFYSSLG